METQNKKILEHLEAGNGISSMLAFKKWNITRLAARIFDLRKAGHDVFGKMVEHGNSRFKLYYLRDSNMFHIHGESY